MRDDRDLADLESIKRTIVDLAILLRDPRATAGVKRRATKAIAETSIQAIDTALALLRERERADHDQAMVP